MNILELKFSETGFKNIARKLGHRIIKEEYIENLLKKAVQQIDERNEILRRKGFKDLNSMYKAGKGNIPYWINYCD